MELDKNKLLSFNAYYQIMTLPSFNSLDDMIKNHILISCSSFQNEIDDILYKLQGIQKILLQPLNEFYEYLKDVEAKVEGLKKVRPDCEFFKQSYEDVYGEYRRILGVVSTHLDERHGILEGYKRTLETKKEDINGYINTLNRQATICSLWLEIESRLLSARSRRCLKQA
ncbi:MAG: hypothetical protein QXU11_05165 [Thermoproteota archaeon]